MAWRGPSKEGEVADNPCYTGLEWVVAGPGQFPRDLHRTMKQEARKLPAIFYDCVDAIPTTAGSLIPVVALFLLRVQQSPANRGTRRNREISRFFGR